MIPHCLGQSGKKRFQGGWKISILSGGLRVAPDGFSLSHVQFVFQGAKKIRKYIKTTPTAQFICSQIKEADLKVGDHNFLRINIAENWLCWDSDAVFNSPLRVFFCSPSCTIPGKMGKKFNPSHKSWLHRSCKVNSNIDLSAQRESVQLKGTNEGTAEEVFPKSSRI